MPKRPNGIPSCGMYTSYAKALQTADDGKQLAEMGPAHSGELLKMDSEDFPPPEDATKPSGAMITAQKRVHNNRRNARKKPISKRVDTRPPGKVPQAVAPDPTFQKYNRCRSR